MNFSRLYMQSWWEVPSIAYFCSLFRTAFDLLDFDIEELEEALLTDGSEDTASSLLTELIVRLLNGCLGNNDISAFNYQMYLRRLFRRKCQTGRYNPFNTDIDFQFLPLRTKVEILYALCDFRLDADDVYDLFKNLEAESLRVEPLGWDDNDSAYWYFYGTRLYREDFIRKPKGKNKKKKNKESRRRGLFYGHEATNDGENDRVWQVVCFTEDDWTHLTEKFSKATSKVEKELHRSLSQNFLPEIPRLFQEKERLQRKRLLELPRRTSNRVLQKIKQKEEETKPNENDVKEEEDNRDDTPNVARENRAKRRNLLRSKSVSSISSKSAKEEMPQKVSKRSKSQDKKSKKSSSSHKKESPPEPPVKTGRKTNNSLASATGQIVIPDNDEPVSSTRKKLKTSQIFSQSDEDVQTDMYKVLEQLTAHDDAWPFMDPVEEEYAPNYYAVIRRPMDLHKMEKRLDNGYYTDFSMFKADFKLIVNNCRLYNGQDNEYTKMVDNLQTAFDRLTEKYIHRLSSSDEEIAVEFQVPAPSRKHKLNSSESQSHHKKKKRKSHSETSEPKSSSSDLPEETNQESLNKEVIKSKESHKNKEGKIKKKHRSHHRHGKHSKSHKKNSHKSGHGNSSKNKRGKKQKHSKNKDKSKKSKKKKNKHREVEITEVIKRSASQESIESSNRSRSASPLPSIHTPSPSPTELDQTDLNDQSEQPNQPSDPEFVKDKFDKIKERRRTAAKEAWESLFDGKQKGTDKPKQNLTCPEKDKNKNLTETIEKLKAKNEKYKDNSLFNNLFTPTNSNNDKAVDSNKKTTNKEDPNDIQDNNQIKNSPKKGSKKNTAKNESASEALEEAVKDISKWLDEAPKSSSASSPSDSPPQTTPPEDHEIKRIDNEAIQSDKIAPTRKETTRKRRSSREPRLLKRREIQRTIDRLQPGKSKGNLLTNITNKAEKTEEVTAVGLLSKVRDSSKGEDSSLKLTLGSVLPTVQFTLGSDHNFGNTDEIKTDSEKTQSKEPANNDTLNEEQVCPENKYESGVSVQPNKKDAEVETEPTVMMKPSQEKATPNLSAWFKAFGAPKSTPTASVVRKKVEEADTEEKPTQTPIITEPKLTSSKNVTKLEPGPAIDNPNPEGGESPLPNIITTPRQRRTSTGSSMSERSSFSQDLDSPRHQIAHTSPLIQSPASPRVEDFQKITYPIINGTVRAGFYQDTTSMKSSPEKSCSPREAPQSPFSPYSQHVYASNNVAGSTTPQYFADQNKSPLPTYTQNPPPYYDTSKVPGANKPRVHVDYTALGPDSYQRNQYTGTFAPGYTPMPPISAPDYPSQIQQLQSQPPTNAVPAIITNSAPITTESKAYQFPVKKRTYNEPHEEIPVPARTPEIKVPNISPQNIIDYQKQQEPMPTSTPSLSSNLVDDIALALCEKSDIAKLNNICEKPTPEYVERNIIEHKEPVKLNNVEAVQAIKKETTVDVNKPKTVNNVPKAINSVNKDNIDMVNMGYMIPDDRKLNGETHNDHTASARDVPKHGLNPQPKVYEATAINLGVNNHTFLKPTAKPIINSGNIPPAHKQDRSSLNDIGLNQIMAHSHHNQYDTLSSNQGISSFSMNDIEQANKKLYACNGPPSSVAIDYGNWKISSQIRKQDVAMASDYSTTSYNANHSEKTKPCASNVAPNAINYNKNVHQQQYNAYVPRNNTQRAPQEFQQNLPSELRIPNPRGLLKMCDHVNLCSSSVNTDSLSKSIDTLAKSQKPEKVVQNHPLVTSNPYKPPYSNHSSLIPQMLDRYSNEERYSLAFAGSGTSIYHDKQFQMAQIFNKSMPSDVNSAITASTIPYSQSAITLNKDNISTYKSTASVMQSDMKRANKRKRSESKSSAVVNQTYHNPVCGNDVLSSVKSSMMPASAFNFGTTTNMALGGGIYGDNAGFSIDANQIMAANYMVAAVAHQQRNNAEAAADKIAKPAHQNSSHTAGTFPFIGHTQVPAGYSFVGTETSSPLYQQYLQRHQEELLRQTGAQIMSLYPSRYPTSLSVRQPYDTINRPSWL